VERVSCKQLSREGVTVVALCVLYWHAIIGDSRKQLVKGNTYKLKIKGTLEL